MSSSIDRARTVTRMSLGLALVPFVASLTNLSNVQRAVASDAGTGVAFPFPTGLPTVWTYTSLSGVGRAGSVMDASGGDLVVVAGAILLGLLVTAVLEAGFLGALWSRLGGGPLAFGDGVRRFTVRMVGVELVRFGVILVVVPLFFALPAVGPLLGFVVALLLTYLVYGLPFVVVARDLPVGRALRVSVNQATSGGFYARFGLNHLVAGAAGSLVVTTVVRNGGLAGVVVGTALVSLPAVFVAVYGLVVFDRHLSERSPRPAA